MEVSAEGIQPQRATNQSNRLLELDALRGIAALSVALFHFTEGYDDNYGHSGELLFHFPYGEFGVELFFMISGLVIFMTLERTKSSLDFLVGRFSRLYPAYWTAVLVSFTIVTLAKLPDRQVSWVDALYNLTMFQKFLDVPNVDGVYWTLTSELCFYIIMFTLHKARLLKHINVIALGWLLLMVLTFVLEGNTSLEISENVNDFLLLENAHLFIAGIMLYKTHKEGFSRWRWGIIAACVFTHLLKHEWSETLLIAVFVLVLTLILKRKLSFISWKPLLFLGTISYSFYLVHQNISYVIIKALYESNINPNISVFIALITTILLATLITFLVEKPMLHFLRAQYQKKTSQQPSPQQWEYFHGLKLFIVIVLALGIFFRVINLDYKVYWHDETATSLRISGYSKAQFVQEVFNGQPIRVEEIHQRYQSPNSQRRWGDVVQAFMSRPEHSPLYYLMARLWAQLFGSSVAVMRSLPVLISLLTFPAIYWLCRELFNSSLVGWMAMALVAVSPVHVLYAQEARQYSLWTVTLLLSSASLLWAIRLPTKISWGVYAASISLGLYSHLFFGLVALGHGIYILVREGIRHSQITIAYLLASLAGFLTFLPWFWVVITGFLDSQNRDRVMTGMKGDISFPELVEKWFRNINRGFHDADLNAAYIILVILSIYAIYFVCRHTPKQVGWFILTFMGVTAVTLVLPDLILGGQRSVRTRYLMPCFLGIQLSVAYLLATQIFSSAKIWQRRFWQLVTVVIISAGVVSGVVSSQSQVAWTKNISVTKHYPKIAGMINQTENTLVISDSSETNVLCLSYLLDPDVTFQLVRQPNPLKISPGFSEIFLFDISEQLLQELQQTNSYQIEPLVDQKRARLWKLTLRIK